MRRKASGKQIADLELADALHSAAIHLLRRLRREDAATGLTALSVVVFGGPLRISDLARAEQVKVPTITPVVVALEDDGLITRAADPNDARASILRATPRGEKLMAEGRARRVASLAAELPTVPTADRQLLARAAALIERLARGTLR
jgi:DNA-binding MarR family transcriptional regulator